MILTIWRHGTAEDGANDRLRALTMAGRDDLRVGCSQLHGACDARNISPPTVVLHSPWVRTTQTAEIIVSAFNPLMVDAESVLWPGGDAVSVGAVVSDLSDNSSAQHIVLVSHQPLVSYVLDHYLGDTGAVPPLSPGGRATLSLDVTAADCGQLLFWAMPPSYKADV